VVLVANPIAVPPFTCSEDPGDAIPIPTEPFTVATPGVRVITAVPSTASGKLVTPGGVSTPLVVADAEAKGNASNNAVTAKVERKNARRRASVVIHPSFAKVIYVQ
jgi:hypothetical protein